MRPVFFHSPLRARAAVERRRRDLAAGADHGTEIDRCAASAAYFADTFAVIDDTQGESSAAMPFRLWPDQWRVMEDLQNERLTVILKARQLGITWLVCVFALWLCIFKPGRLVLLFSKGQLEANEMLRRIKAVYDRLPDWIKAYCPHRPGDADTKSEFGFANGSLIRSLPATKGAGRSFTASLAIFDECAWMAWGSELYRAAKPTIDAGGRLIVLSTANGLGGLFHSLWTKAVAKINDFKAIFLPWSSRPGRDDAWYAKVTSESDDPALIPQEYPANALEAFISSGRLRFLAAWLQKQAANVAQPISLDLFGESLADLADGSLRLYATPDEIKKRAAGGRLIISADVAEGKQRDGVPVGDYSAAVLVDAAGVEWGTLHGRWEPDEYARRLWIIAREFGAWVLVERNNHGHAVLVGLNHRQAFGDVVILSGVDGSQGWLTTAATKPTAVSGLAARLRDGWMRIRTQATLDELQVYRVTATGGTESPPGYHDDLVMAWANLCGWLDTVGSVEFDLV